MAIENLDKTQLIPIIDDGNDAENCDHNTTVMQEYQPHRAAIQVKGFKNINIQKHPDNPEWELVTYEFDEPVNLVLEQGQPAVAVNSWSIIYKNLSLIDGVENKIYTDAETIIEANFAALTA